MTTAAAIHELRLKFRGELITPGDADYEAARKVYNGMIDRRPALIARCANVADVVSGVNFAREKKLLLAVRGGGHNGPGLGVCDAAQRVGKADTAWSFREASFAEVIVGVDPDPAANPRLVQWAKDYWLALHPFSAGGAYLNMQMDEGEDSVKAAYRDNYARLAQVKRKYDPGNLFRVNQNIKPA